MGQGQKTDKEREYDLYQKIAFWFLRIGVLILIVGVVMVLINYRPSINFNHDNTQTVGIFIAGVVPVFISSATVLLIYITFTSNREEFKKISDANNFQQFQMTFDNMCKSLETIIEDYHNRETIKMTLSDSHSETNKTVNLIIDYCKGITYALIESIFTSPNTKPKKHIDEIPETSKDQDIHLLLSTSNYFGLGVDMRVLNSGITLAFEYLEKNLNPKLGVNDKFEADQEYYIFKLKRILNDNSIKKVLILNGFIDKRLKIVIERFSLFEGLPTDLTLKYKRYNSPSDNSHVGWFDYSFNLLTYYDKKAFIRDE